MKQSEVVCALLGVLFTGTSGAGCLVRAPTSYELDKRAGNGLPPADPAYEHPRRYKRKGQSFEEPLRATSGIAPAPLLPARTAPVIRRVWVADQTLPDGSWLQGTWWYLEAEPSRWLHEIDPGAAPFAEPERAPESESEPKAEPGSAPKSEPGSKRRRREATPSAEALPSTEAETEWFGPFQVEH